jgi:hypothetical protein
MNATSLLITALLSICVDAPTDMVLPENVSVLPVFFVPNGEALPTADQESRLVRHLKWCRDRYRTLLRGDTFRLVETPEVYRGERDSAFYRQRPQGAAPDLVGELLRSKKMNRYNCPYIFFIVVMSADSDWIGGGARPFNGGNNLGGGLVEVTSYGLDHSPNVQSTIRHELGHSFGLPHVDVYGQDMETHRSMMAYNPGHLTNGFQDSATPGEFSPEDLRAIALNKRCFAKFQFDPAEDIPTGESICPEIVCLGPMEIAGEGDFDPARIAPDASSGNP